MAWQKADRELLSVPRMTWTFFAPYIAFASNTIAVVRCRTREGLHRNRKPPSHAISSRTHCGGTCNERWGAGRTGGATCDENARTGSDFTCAKEKSCGKIVSAHEGKKSRSDPLWLIANSVMQNPCERS